MASAATSVSAAALRMFAPRLARLDGRCTPPRRSSQRDGGSGGWFEGGDSGRGIVVSESPCDPWKSDGSHRGSADPRCRGLRPTLLVHPLSRHESDGAAARAVIYGPVKVSSLALTSSVATHVWFVGLGGAPPWGRTGGGACGYGRFGRRRGRAIRAASVEWARERVRARERERERLERVRVREGSGSGSACGRERAGATAPRRARGGFRAGRQRVRAQDRGAARAGGKRDAPWRSGGRPSLLLPNQDGPPGARALVSASFPSDRSGHGRCASLCRGARFSGAALATRRIQGT
ncbi:MAG: hypothetical protein QOI41_4062 [Myxococcales bacterium]|nr:hypothetical protein [Myxococcales bacterium]